MGQAKRRLRYWIGSCCAVGAVGALGAAGCAFSAFWASVALPADEASPPPPPLLIFTNGPSIVTPDGPSVIVLGPAFRVIIVAAPIDIVRPLTDICAVASRLMLAPALTSTLAPASMVTFTAPFMSRFAPALDATAPTLLDIVSPPASHATLLPQALSYGIATICQKPFCTDYAQAREQSERFARAGVPLVVHENFRFMPWFREARRLIDTGRIGRLHGASFRLRPGDGQGPRAYLDRQPYFQQMPRLLVAETAIHLIDSFRFLLGEVADVSARLRRLNPAIQGEDAATIELGFAGDAIGLIDGNRLNEHAAANQRRTMGEIVPGSRVIGPDILEKIGGGDAQRGRREIDLFISGKMRRAEKRS